MRERPDYHVVGRNSMTAEEGPIGAAWRRDDGSIEIQLCPFTQLMASPSLIICLLPAAETPTTAEANDDVTAATSPSSAYVQTSIDEFYGDLDSFDHSDIPF